MMQTLFYKNNSGYFMKYCVAKFGQNVQMRHND